MHKFIVCSVFLVACSSVNGTHFTSDEVREAPTSFLVPSVPICVQDNKTADVQACMDIESNSHSVYCPSSANPPTGAFETDTKGVWCWCRPGECIGVLDCVSDQECDWTLTNKKCIMGYCQ